MTTRRTALKGMAGAFALSIGGFHWDTANAQAQAPKRGGTLVFAISAETPHYDPHASDTFATLDFAAPFYSTLLQFDLAKYPAVKGDLAQSWTVAPDLMTYTFKLQPNVKFNDGSTLTSASNAAIAANPGATVKGASTETDSSLSGAAYEVHIVKSDGTRAVVTEDSSFNVLATQAEPGPGPGGHHGS